MRGVLASLPMYDWPETRDALARLWGLIRAELSANGIEAPRALDHQSAPFSHWISPNLLISQTCGWPYANHLKNHVFPFARFDYGVTGCPPGYYRSVYIGQRLEDKHWIETPGQIEECPCIAINGDDSQSGFHVFSEISNKASQDSIPEAHRVITGAHRESVKSVAGGKARIAAIDGVAFELARKFEPAAFSKVCVLGYSTPKPGLPLVTALSNEALVPTLFQAISRALEKAGPKDKDSLLINGVLGASPADYEIFVNSQNG